MHFQFQKVAVMLLGDGRACNVRQGKYGELGCCTARKQHATMCHVLCVMPLPYLWPPLVASQAHAPSQLPSALTPTSHHMTHQLTRQPDEPGQGKGGLHWREAGGRQEGGMQGVSTASRKHVRNQNCRACGQGVCHTCAACAHAERKEAGRQHACIAEQLHLTHSGAHNQHLHRPLPSTQAPAQNNWHHDAITMC